MDLEFGNDVHKILNVQSADDGGGDTQRSGGPALLAVLRQPDHARHSTQRKGRCVRRSIRLMGADTEGAVQ